MRLLSYSTIARMLCGLAAVAALSGHAHGSAVTFEGLTDGEVVAGQFPGLSFQNSGALRAGLSLNELEFPPFSGDTVIFDDGGAIRIDFDEAVSTVGAYFTYGLPITLTALGASDEVLGSITSSFSSNMLLSGEIGTSPNEFLAVVAPGIRALLVLGNPSGASFVLDDLTYSTVSTVPEPTTFGLATLALLLLALRALPGVPHRRRQ